MKTFIPLFGLPAEYLHSIQGLLKMSFWYGSEGSVRFSFQADDSHRPKSMYATLLRLQKEGYIELVLDPSQKDDSIGLVGITLTTSGHKLLTELEEKSFRGKFTYALWTIVISIVTTLITLHFKTSGK